MKTQSHHPLLSWQAYPLSPLNKTEQKKQQSKPLHPCTADVCHGGNDHFKGRKTIFSSKEVWITTIVFNTFVTLMQDFAFRGSDLLLGGAWLFCSSCSVIVALSISSSQDSSCSVKGALRNQTCPHHDDSLGRTVSVAQAVVSQQSQAGVEEQRGHVPQVQQRLHQRDGPHGPVAAELRWIQQQPRIHGKKVVEGHLSCGGGSDCCWIIEPARGAREQRRAETGWVWGQGAFLYFLS